jgi:hypothetical protein
LSPGRNSSWASPEHNSEALPLEPPCWVGESYLFGSLMMFCQLVRFMQYQMDEKVLTRRELV